MNCLATHYLTKSLKKLVAFVEIEPGSSPSDYDFGLVSDRCYVRRIVSDLPKQLSRCRPLG